MQHLGQTRSSRQPDHFLLTPDTFVRAPLPGMRNATAIVHAAPVHGAGFTEYTVEFEADGSMETGDAQTFLYVLAGSVRVGGKDLAANGYAYVPPRSEPEILASTASRAVVIEKPFVKLHDEHPTFFSGDERAIVGQPLGGDDALQVRCLVPGDFQYDFAVNTMTFGPGASLSMVEIHVMEHGLLMLEGEGIYRLNDRWYPVIAGDFIYMAPYCPQWFAAIGKRPAKYLIYKDWNRHPLAGK
jgi:(S)-ureidoglycine aminohydrolase